MSVNETGSESIRFETPENITVSYELAGLGTRFEAWVFDMLLIVLCTVVLAVMMGIAGFAASLRVGGFGGMSEGVLLAMFLILVGSLPILYFLLFELLMNGQTPGKRSVQIRVVSAEGFSLSFWAVFFRNIFRLLDTIPVFWCVPFLTDRSQRFGDMIAGTVVVLERAPNLADEVSLWLLNRNPVMATFRFTPAQLRVLTDEEFTALEQFVNRRLQSDPKQTQVLTARMVNAFTARMEYPSLPLPTQHGLFLEELLAARLRQQVSGLK